MSLASINNYVNEMITSNRDQTPEHIMTYFALMTETAEHMLARLRAAERLIGLEGLPVELLNQNEKIVIREAVDYILANSIDLKKDLSVIHTSGLLDLTDSTNNRFHMLYNIEAVLRLASEMYFAKLNWWKAFTHRNKPANYFVLKFEEATGTNMNSVEMTDGLKTAR